MMGMMKKVKKVPTLAVGVMHKAEYGSQNEYKSRLAAITRGK